jgi:hypothetical protein
MSADLISSTPWMRPRGRASRPRTVLNAARLMDAVAALELATPITIVATAGSVKAAMLNSDPAP